MDLRLEPSAREYLLRQGACPERVLSLLEEMQANGGLPLCGLFLSEQLKPCSKEEAVHELELFQEICFMEHVRVHVYAA